MPHTRIPLEGEIYKHITVDGRKFTLLYGYYSESERALGIPIPILPDFQSDPIYSLDGLPFVTRVQDACEHYRCRIGPLGDGWCADCIHYPEHHDEIGICQCENNRSKHINR